MDLSHDIGLNEALSGIFGSISLASWMCLLLPQLYENYKSQSAEGLSMIFLGIWLFGDITSLLGASAAGIAPTAILLATYFCFSDVVLISQSLYYKTLQARRARQRTRSTGTDRSDEPLLRRRRTSSVGIPGAQRRNSMRQQESSFGSITHLVTGEDETPDTNPWLHNSLSLLAVWIIGAVGWFISYKIGAWDRPEVPDEPTSAETTSAVVGMVLGYVSALCYLCARIPQIIKNYREKSCEGLALLFFLLSLTGNSTYGASVLSYSQDPAYLIKATPWLLGSLGTMIEDCIIFYQFRIYAPKAEQKSNGTV